MKVIKAKKTKKIKQKQRKSFDSGIEEIRLVRVAVNAFKRKKRLRDLPKNGRRKFKKSKFESVVEKVMKMREQEEKIAYNAKEIYWVYEKKDSICGRLRVTILKFPS